MKLGNLSLLAAIAGLGLLGQAAFAAGHELWVAGALTDAIGSPCAIARYSAKDGSILGYFMHPTPGVGQVTSPGNGTIHEVEVDGKHIYVAHGPQNFKVARYDRNGGNAVVDLITGVGGDWYVAAYRYEIRGLAFTTDHIHVLGGVWSTEPRYPELERGTYIFRHTREGAIAGVQPNSLSGYSRGAQFSAPPAISGITTACGLARDSVGNFYAITTGPSKVSRFTPAGEHFGPGGIGDTNAWITSADMPVSTSPFWPTDIILDQDDRLYLVGDCNGVTVSYVVRFNADGTPAPAPGKSGAVFTTYVNYLKGVVRPRAMAIGPHDGHLYVANAYFNLSAGRRENMVNRFYIDGANDGKLIEEGGFANLGGENAPIYLPTEMFFVEKPAIGTSVLIR